MGKKHRAGHVWKVEVREESGKFRLWVQSPASDDPIPAGGRLIKGDADGAIALPAVDFHPKSKADAERQRFELEKYLKALEKHVSK